MVKLLLRLIALSAAIFSIPYVLPGVKVESVSTAIVAALVLAILNVSLRPVLKILTFPINFLTLGLFTLVINTIILLLVEFAVEGFEIAGFWEAFVAAIFVSVFNMLLRIVFVKKTRYDYDDDDDEDDDDDREKD